MDQPKAAAVTVMQFYPRFVVLGLCMKVVLWVLSLSFAVLQMCLCGARTHIVHIHKLTFRIHRGCLNSTPVWLFIRKTHLSSPDPILQLVLASMD